MNAVRRGTREHLEQLQSLLGEARQAESVSWRLSREHPDPDARSTYTKMARRARARAAELNTKVARLRAFLNTKTGDKS